MRKTLVASAVLALAGLAPSARAGGQQVIAEAALDGRSIVVRTYRCGTPASLSLRATAEGIVGGQRRTMKLEVTPAAEPGAFNVARQWPAEGRWALVFTVAGGHSTSALVTLEPGPEVRIASQESTYERPSAERVAAVLASAR
jgi:hypothetical protein